MVVREVPFSKVVKKKGNELADVRGRRSRQREQQGQRPGSEHTWQDRGPLERPVGVEGRERERRRGQSVAGATPSWACRTAGTLAITLSEMRASGELLSREAFPSRV